MTPPSMGDWNHPGAGDEAERISNIVDRAHAQAAEYERAHRLRRWGPIAGIIVVTVIVAIVIFTGGSEEPAPTEPTATTPPAEQTSPHVEVKAPPATECTIAHEGRKTIVTCQERDGSETQLIPPMTAYRQETSTTSAP